MKTMSWLLVSMLSPWAASTAIAQPDPFADYENGQSSEVGDAGDGWLEPSDEPGRTVVSEVDEPVALSLKAGGWSAGVRSALSWTTARNELVGGGNEANTNLFVRVAPSVTWFVIDRLELGGSLGLLAKSIARPDGTASETDWVLEVTAHYHLPLTERFALAPGLGLGGYFGSSSRPVEATVDGESRIINEGTSTVGGIGAAYLEGVYQLAPALQLRAGLAFTALLGSESLEATEEKLAIRTFNTGLSLGFYYNF